MERSFPVTIGITTYIVTGEHESAERDTNTHERCAISSVTIDGEEISDADFELLSRELETGWLLANHEDETESRWAASTIGGAL